MKTNYGELDIVVDLKTNRAKRAGSGVVGTRRGSNPSKSAGSSPASSPSSPYDSKLEAARANYWDLLQRAKQIRRYVYHPFTIQIAPKKTYTPDFLIEQNDGRLVIEEIKGSLKMKNARDSITRLHVAAGLFPMFDWQLTLRTDGIWEETCIPKMN